MAKAAPRSPEAGAGAEHQAPPGQAQPENEIKKEGQGLCLSPFTVLMASDIPGSVFGKCDLNPQMYSRYTHTGDRNMIRRPERGKLQWIFLWKLKKNTIPRMPTLTLAVEIYLLWLVESSANWKPRRQYSSTWLVWSGKYKTNNVPNQTDSYGVGEGRTIVWYFTGGTDGSRRFDIVLYLMVQVLEETATGCGL